MGGLYVTPDTRYRDVDRGVAIARLATSRHVSDGLPHRSMLSRVAADGITAVKTRSTFRMQCAVSADIEAAPDRVWALLTRADDMVRWNSTLTSVEGSVEPRGSVRMQVPEAPSRTFKIKVSKFVPNQEMVWRNGNPVIFLAVRTYSLTPNPDHSITRFRMTEVFSGLMLPMVARRLPDFGPIFERYAADLKAEAEKNRT